jgi:hypothetical protein
MPRFSARARGDDRPDSDIDIMVEIEPEAHVGVWGYTAIVHAIEGCFLCRWTFRTAPPRSRMSVPPPNAKRFMHSESLQTRLYDIRDNILLTQEFVGGLDFPLSGPGVLCYKEP